MGEQHLQPEVHYVAGHITTQRYRYEGKHIILVVGTEQMNVGFRATRMHWVSRNKYDKPHQGAQECARRRRQVA